MKSIPEKYVLSVIYFGCFYVTIVSALSSGLQQIRQSTQFCPPLNLDVLVPYI